MGVLAFSTSENCARLKYKISRENLRWKPLNTPLQKNVTKYLIVKKNLI